MTTIVLLFFSNVFMTIAWYWHLKHKEIPMFTTILLCWGIAFFEYCLQVPANRWGHGQFNAAQLKTIQEVMSLSTFAVFSVVYLGEKVRWNHILGFALIVLAAYVLFLPTGEPAAGSTVQAP